MNVNNLTYSANGLKLTEQFEGLSLKAYQDVAGVWTNGYGNTHGVTPGSTMTLEQAQADLASNIEGAAYVVNMVVTVALTQNQFDALVDFVFNLGAGNFQSSTLLRKLNSGDYVGASGQFPLWNHAGGVVVAGLTRRRLAEQALFNMTELLVPVVQPVDHSGVTSASVVSGIADDIQKAENFITDLQSKLP